MTDLPSPGALHAGSGAAPAPSGSERPRDYVLALGLGLLALVLYGLTVQRTLSFWDCGEFIACSAVLGIPHPPGTALFILLGRLFTHLPWPGDIGFRVNLVSVVFGSMAVSTGYLIVVRLVRRHVFPEFRFWGREWLLFLCGSCGALSAGFGSTTWINATEAEVYGLTLFLFFLLIYVTVIWYDVRGTATASRLLIFATFIAVLGLGAHMMVYLALPGLWLAVFASDPEARRDWRQWVAAFATLSVMVTGIEVFLWNLGMVLVTGLYYRWAPRAWVARASFGAVVLLALLLYGLFELTLPLRQVIGPEALPGAGSLGRFFASFQWTWADWISCIVVLVACIAGSFWTSRAGASPLRGAWGLPVGLVLAALAAFSLQAYVPIRSAQDPALDENNPETWEGVKGFLERKQYGRESMITRMFHRRGEWSHQLGRHPRMGFWSFFETQYGLKSGPLDEAGTTARPPAFLLLLALGLWGALGLAWRRPRIGWPLFLVLLFSTVGLVIYMNFADGTRFQARSADQAYLEVRDRDYFFTTGFALFGLCLGLGVANFLRAFLEPGSRLYRPVVWAASAVFLFSLPIKTVHANFWMHDRSRNHVPYDYARNLLESCEQNALLFTNGDNDTFPLWCLQEAYGIRRDVRIINLSLANTHWYIHQVKDYLRVPFDLSGEQIDRLRPDARLGRVQDQVVNTVLESNRWREQVYFGSSTPEGSRVFRGATLDSNLVMEGLVMRLVRERGFRMVDQGKVLQRYQGGYRLRGLSDSTLYLDEATQRIADNYASALLFVADAYRRRTDADSAMATAAVAARLRPRLDPPRHYLVQMAGELNRREVLDSMLNSATPPEQADLYYHYGLASEFAGDSIRAVDAYRRALQAQPEHEAAFARCAGLQFSRGDWDSLLVTIDAWIAANPRDTVGPKLRAEALAYRGGSVPPGGAP